MGEGGVEGGTLRIPDHFFGLFLTQYNAVISKDYKKYTHSYLTIMMSSAVCEPFLCIDEIAEVVLIRSKKYHILKTI